jgi:hypothetical protein
VTLSKDVYEIDVDVSKAWIESLNHYLLAVQREAKWSAFIADSYFSFCLQVYGHTRSRTILTNGKKDDVREPLPNVSANVVEQLTTTRLYYTEKRLRERMIIEFLGPIGGEKPSRHESTSDATKRYLP